MALWLINRGPPLTYRTPRNKGLIFDGSDCPCYLVWPLKGDWCGCLIKGNQWLISPDHKAGYFWGGQLKNMFIEYRIGAFPFSDQRENSKNPWNHREDASTSTRTPSLGFPSLPLLRLCRLPVISKTDHDSCNFNFNLHSPRYSPIQGALHSPKLT